MVYLCFHELNKRRMFIQWWLLSQYICLALEVRKIHDFFDFVSKISWIFLEWSGTCYRSIRWSFSMENSRASRLFIILRSSGREPGWQFTARSTQYTSFSVVQREAGASAYWGWGPLEIENWRKSDTSRPESFVGVLACILILLFSSAIY